MPDTLSVPPAASVSTDVPREEHLACILEKQPVCLARLDVDGTFLAVNEAACALLGAEQLDQILDTSLLQIVAPYHRDASRIFLKRVATGEPRSIQIDLFGLSGAGRCVELHGVPHPTTASGGVSVLCAFHDVTRYRQLEQGLLDNAREHEHRLSTHAAATAALETRLAESQQLATQHARQLDERQRELDELTARRAEERQQHSQQLDERQRELDELTARRAEERQQHSQQLEERQRELDALAAHRAEERQRLESAVADLRQQLERAAEDRRRWDDAAAREHEQRVAEHAAATTALEARLAESQQLADQHARLLDDRQRQLDELAARQGEERRQLEADVAVAQRQLAATTADYQARLALVEETQRESIERAADLERIRLQHERALANHVEQVATLEEQLAAAAQRERDLVELRRADEERWRQTAAEAAAAHTALEARLAEKHAAMAAIHGALEAARADRDRLTGDAHALAAERRALVDRLDRQARLTETGRLAASIAADIEDRLRALTSLGRMLLPALDPSRRERAEQMLAAGYEAAMLASRLTGTPSSAAAHSTNVGDVVTGLAPMLGALLGPKVSLQVLPASPDVCADVPQGHFEQQLLTVVAVVRAAIGDAGRLTLEFAEVDIDTTLARERAVRPGKRVLVAVHAEAAGVAERLPAEIFEDSRRAEGWPLVGPGMTAVVEIVGAAGGHLWASREGPDRAAIEVYLPTTGEDTAVDPSGAEAR